MRWQPEITLTEDEILLVQAMAEARTREASSRYASHHFTSRWTHGGGVDYLGVAGELVARKWFGLPERWEDGYRHGACDFTLHGRRIDVKTTKYFDGRLFVNEKVSGNADAFVLVRGNARCFHIAGWMSARELIHDERRPKQIGRAHV